MFSRTAPTVRLYLYHNRYVLSFLSFGPSSGRGEIPVTAVPGCPNTGGSTQWACASRRLWWGSFGGLRTTANGRVLFQRGARSGPPCGVWAGVRLDEPTTGERLRNLQESDVSLQQRLQVSRAAHGLVFRNLRNEEYRHWCDHPAILRQCCTPPRCMLFAGSHGERLCRRVGDSQL